jgi:hypothetical protein
MGKKLMLILDRARGRGPRTPDTVPYGRLCGVLIASLSEVDLRDLARYFFRREPEVQRAILAELARRGGLSNRQRHSREEVGL